MQEQCNKRPHPDPPHFHGRSHLHRSRRDGSREWEPLILSVVPQELSLLSLRRCITKEIEINAPCAVVWKVLTDLPGYSSWNPFIRRIAGDLSVGRHLRVLALLPCGLLIPLWPKILELAAERKIRWLGRLFLPSLLDGEHIFLLEPLGETRSRFTQMEEYRGALLPIVWNWLRDQGRTAFEMMNGALKKSAERLYESSF